LSVSLPNPLILSMRCNCPPSYERGKKTLTHLFPLSFRIRVFSLVIASSFCPIVSSTCDLAKSARDLCSV
jgi:hypothetical protein